MNFYDQIRTVSAKIESLASPRNLTVMYLVLGFLPILAFSRGLSELATSFLVSQSLSDWVRPIVFLSDSFFSHESWLNMFVYAAKKKDFFVYISMCIGTGIYFLWGLHITGALRLSRCFPQQLKWPWQALPSGVYFLVEYFLFDRISLMPFEAYHKLAAALLVWLGLLMLPFIAENVAQNRESERVLMPRFLGYGACGIFIVGILWVFLPFLKSPVYVLDDSLNLPSTTLLADGSELDTISYLNSSNLFGTQIFDARVNSATSCPFNREIGIADSFELRLFLRDKSARFWYDDKMGQLCLMDDLNTYEEETISGLLPPQSQRKLRSIAHRSEFVQKQLVGKNFSARELEFIRAIEWPLHLEIQNRMFIFHWNFQLQPVLGLLAGKNIDELVIQYGKDSVRYLYWVAQVVGRWDINTFLMSWFPIYIAYYMAILGFTYLLFGFSFWFLLASSAILASVFWMGHYAWYLSPGFSPLRHLFDVACVTCFLLATRKKSALLMYAALFLAIVSVRLYPLMGVPLFFACATAFVIVPKSVIRLSLLRRIIILFLCSACVVALLMSSKSAVSGGTLYYFSKGLLSSGMQFSELSWAAMLLILVFVTVLIPRKNQSCSVERSNLVLVAIYCFGIFLYYVWQPAPPQFFVYSFWYVIMVALAGKLALECFLGSYSVSYIAKLLLPPMVVIALVPGALFFVSGRKRFEQQFLVQKSHSWRFGTNNLVTTKEPLLIRESIEVIQQYCSDKKVMYLFSKYDSFLPILSGKYNDVIYPNLAAHLYSKYEVEKVVSWIEKVKPKIIFADRDIAYERIPEIIPPQTAIVGYLHGESVSRHERLEVFSRLFSTVSEKYHKIDERGLLAVYERNDNR